MKSFDIAPRRLDLPALRQLEDSSLRIGLAGDARAAIRQGRGILEGAIAAGQRIYGVTTGSGPLSDTVIDAGLQADMQRRLVLSNAVGVGPPLSARVTRTIMILKVATFASGATGVTEALADRMLTLLNADCLPVIPSKGSVGASGDLAPLAHLGAFLLGFGEALLAGDRMPAAQALKRLGLAPYRLASKEGLAMVNGTQVSTALAVDGLLRTEEHFAAALACAALSVEAGSGTAAAFDSRIQALRDQPGQTAVAEALRELLAGSPLQQDRPVKRLQDPYCLRCIPQVMGAALDQILQAAATLDREVRAVTDNPLIDTGSGDIMFGGNFHAQPIGFAADILALALSEIGALSERRVAFLVDPGMSGLPAFLVREGGINSGFMVAQVTAAALVSENKHLANAVSTDSLPTAANQEDHVSMATYAARRLGDMAENLGAILAVELLSAGQGLDLRRPARSSPRLEALHMALRLDVPPWQEDRYFAPDIAAARAVLNSRAVAEIGVGIGLPSLS